MEELLYRQCSTPRWRLLGERQGRDRQAARDAVGSDTPLLQHHKHFTFAFLFR